MVWVCEDCNEEVNVLPETEGVSYFSKDESLEEIKNIMSNSWPANFLLRCYECDSTKLVWKVSEVR